MNDTIYTPDAVIKTYTHIHDLLVTKYIIKNYSTNNNDIRAVALGGINISSLRKILDLGCGYGFFIEKLKGRLHPEAYITGIDLVGNNREAFIETVLSIGARGSFIEGNADMIKKIKGNLYDFIISSYSLYFFPHLIKEISRILKPDGLFLIVTHSENSLIEVIQFIPGCMEKIGLPRPAEVKFNRLFRAFSLENGKEKLSSYFEEIELIEYKNSMNFPQDNIDDCVYYVEKKRPFVYKEVMDQYPDRVIDMESCLSQCLYDYAKKKGGIVLTKDDAVFRCYKSRKT